MEVTIKENVPLDELFKIAENAPMVDASSCFLIIQSIIELREIKELLKKR
ncbi:MAG: hypothetical protein WCE94_15165 [Candidatus Methanoperedens sp.]